MTGRDELLACPGGGAAAEPGLRATCPRCGLRLRARLAVDSAAGLRYLVPQHGARPGDGRAVA